MSSLVQGTLAALILLLYKCVRVDQTNFPLILQYLPFQDQKLKEVFRFRSSANCEMNENDPIGTPALISFPELRRCLIGNWPLPPLPQTSFISYEDPHECICRLISQRRNGAITKLNVCQPDDPDVTKFESSSLVRAYTMRANARLSRPFVNASDMAVLRFMFHTAGGGGLGDHIRGLTESIFMAITAKSPRAFFIDDSSLSAPPLNLTWAVCPGQDAYNWGTPPAWKLQLLNETYKFNPQQRFHEGPTSSGAHNNGWKGSHLALDMSNYGWDPIVGKVIESITNGSVPVISYASNIIHRTALLKVDSVAGLEWYRAFQRLNSQWPALSVDCGGLPWEWSLINSSRTEKCLRSLRPPRLPIGNKKWDTITAAIHPIFDRFFWPSSALLRVVQHRVLHFYKPGKQYVIAIHLRVGTPAADATYKDPPRNNLTESIPAIALCGQMLLNKLTAAYGVREPLWYVATDRPDALPLLRAVLPGTVATLGIRIVTHTRTSKFADKSVQNAGFVDSFADHFMLSTAHAMVASYSGFSATARHWGRIPDSFSWVQKGYTGNSGRDCVQNDYYL